MRLKSETIFGFNAASYNIVNPTSRLRLATEPYDKMLTKVCEEVGTNFDFMDAHSLCLMGFFVTHRNFNNDESMHGYDRNLYYENGERASTDTVKEKHLSWMKDGWSIKATPDKVNFEKLKEMHEKYMGQRLTNLTYESCLKCPVDGLESDWYDDVIDSAYRKNEVWMRKTNPLMLELSKVLSDKSRKVVALWGLGLAEEIRNKLSHEVYSDTRTKDVIELATDWAFGRCKMKQAKDAILKCHAICKEGISDIDSLYCHAIAQGCSTVHTPKHALGLPMYELTAIGKIYGVGNCENAILERYSHYVKKIEFCETQVDKYAGWAQFMC